MGKFDLVEHIESLTIKGKLGEMKKLFKEKHLIWLDFSDNIMVTAIIHNEMKIVNFLLERNFVHDEVIKEAMMTSVRNNNIPAFRMLMVSFMRNDLKTSMFEIELMREAVNCNNYYILQEMLILDFLTEYGSISILDMAIEYEHFPLVRLLINHGASSLKSKNKLLKKFRMHHDKYKSDKVKRTMRFMINHFSNLVDMKTGD